MSTHVAILMIGAIMCWGLALVIAFASSMERFQGRDLGTLAFLYLMSGWVLYILGIIFLLA